jgi:predicted CXXCH cytochrome family protein
VDVQSRSRHALTLKAYDGEGFSGKTLRERGGITYTYDAKGVTIRQGAAERVIALTWLFGAGHYARTPVFEDGGRWVEHRLSWYAATGKLSLTPGHSLQPSEDLDKAAGIVQTTGNATRCFACHKTGDRPGVHCESCHGAQGNHPAAKTIRRDASVAACAGCHRSPAREYASPMPEVEDPLSVRFAPVGFLVSRCYQKSSGKFTCVNCHDPHQSVAASATYDKTCIGCHAPKSKAGCPRSPDCAGCHMPKSTPAPYLTFTDHRIRK